MAYCSFCGARSERGDGELCLACGRLRTAGAAPVQVRRDDPRYESEECPNCGAALSVADSEYCEECGAALFEAEEDDEDETEPDEDGPGDRAD